MNKYSVVFISKKENSTNEKEIEGKGSEKKKKEEKRRKKKRKREKK